jgi:hypothetical protein
MTSATPGIQRRRWRAPRENNGWVVEPSLAEAGDVAAANREHLQSISVSIAGMPLSELRARTRDRIARRAEQSCQMCSRGLHSLNGLWFACGHQPLLAHAGVWVKNIAASALAKHHGGASFNLIVDNDLIGRRAVTIPQQVHGEPRMVSVPFDAPMPPGPGEEAHVQDVSQFESFGDQITQRIEDDWGYAPLIKKFWPTAVEMTKSGKGLVSALSAVRMALEHAHGMGNCEATVSCISQSEEFLIFVRHLAANAAQFRESHNRRLTEYRSANRIRSRSHPVPELAMNGDWCELPFWVWRAGETVRARVFARTTGGSLQLSDGQTPFVSMPDDSGAISDLQALAEQGIRLRPRALTTTLFIRLFLADLFIHGIGGAKYDELTDAIAADFFGIEMPAFMTMTASQWLPLGAPDASACGDWRVANRSLRDARFNAERLVHGEQSSPLATEKQELIQTLLRARENGRPARSIRRETARRLREVEERLAQLAGGQTLQLSEDLKDAERRLAANAVLMNREFPAVLHPESAYAAWVEHIRMAITDGSAH